MMPIAPADAANGAEANERGERMTVAWSFGLLFCVFASWYMLRPIRDAMGIVGDARNLPRFFVLTLAVTLALSPVVSALVSHVPRRRFFGITFRFLGATLLLFGLLLRGPSPSAVVARAFFVWASVINLFAITLAWALIADVFTRPQGLRLFALIGGGGTLGAMFGSLVTAALVVGAGTTVALVLSAVLLEGAVRCVDRIAPRTTEESGRAGYAAGGGTLRWLRDALTSRFFLAICAYLVLFTFTSTVLYLQQATIVKASLTSTTERAAIFARMDLAVNTLTLGLQLFVVGRVLRFIGIGTALAVLPVFTLGVFLALQLAPSLAVLVIGQVSRRALDFALTKPAREVLFTSVRPQDRYKAKSFVDTFVYRAGDALAALGVESGSAPGLVVFMLAACTGWALLGLLLGRAPGLTPAPDPI